MWKQRQLYRACCRVTLYLENSKLKKVMGTVHTKCFIIWENKSGKRSDLMDPAGSKNSHYLWDLYCHIKQTVQYCKWIMKWTWDTNLNSEVDLMQLLQAQSTQSLLLNRQAPNTFRKRASVSPITWWGNQDYLNIYFWVYQAFVYMD